MLTCLRNRILITGLALYLSVAPVFAHYSSSANASVYSTIARQSEDILLKELELERYYIQYWIDAKKEPRFRRTRYFLAQQGAAAGALSQNIMLVSELGRNLGTPDRVSNRILKASNEVAIVSSAVGAGASTFELLSNGWTALQNKRKKRDPKTAANEFIVRVKEIDSLLQERSNTLSSCPESRIKQALLEEGALLKHLRDWCVSDLTDIWADVKSYQAGNSAFFAMDACANWIIMASWILSLRSVDRSNLIGPSIIMSIPADVILTVSAPLSSKIGTYLYNKNKKKLCQMLNAAPHEMSNETEVSIKRLELLTQGMDDSSRILTDTLAERLAVSKTWSNRCIQFIQDREEDIRHLNKVAAQQNIAGPLIGACFIEQDVADCFAYYNYTPRSDRTVNAVAFAGNIVAGAGSATSIGLTAWNYISEIKHRRKLKMTNTDPEQLLQGRLTTIDQLESTLFKGRVTK